MTVEAPAVPQIGSARTDRFHLNRAGILNVWQYDDQEFSFADGRMLLRGTNGAGKSKTLEMLLPFVLDGDKARLTSSARHHTSLLWLMTDGYDGQARVGYLWVEFARSGDETFTCGVGIRASASARTATAWYFTTTRRIGSDLLLEDDAGPLSRQRLAEELGDDGHIFEQARSYKEHVGRALFGLPISQYDEVLRLLYWLRQPQVGEDIEPKRLGEQLLQALPQLDEQAVRAAGETFDELAAFGDQLDRDRARIRELELSPEARDQHRLTQLTSRASELDDAARKAEGGAARAADQWSRREARLVRSAADLVGRLLLLGGRVRDADHAVQDARVDATLSVPAVAMPDRLADVAQAGRLTDALVAVGTDLASAGQAVGRRQAAVRVVAEAVEEHASAQRDCAAEERRAAEAEQRWESSRHAHAEAEAVADGVAEELWERLRAWIAEPCAPRFALPDELTLDLLEGLGTAARDAVAPALDAVRTEQQAAASTRDAAAAELGRLAERRQTIERESDPAPLEPVLGRGARAGGAGLWRLVDFRADLPEAERAGLEAALQSSGLLDAWVRPDGAVLGADQRDVVLPIGPAHPGRTLLEVLQPDCPPDGDVTVDVVTAVLARIALGPGSPEADDVEAHVGLDGSWALGPLRGRAEKDRAQFVGATARAAERTRRLAEIDELISTTRAVHDEAAGVVERLGVRIAELERWREAVPAVQPLLRAWAAVEAKAEVVARDHGAHEEAQRKVLAARELVVRLHDKAWRLAQQHDVPDARPALDALAERLSTVDRDVRDLVRAVPPLRDDVERWGEERGELDADADAVRVTTEDAEQARTLAAQGAAALAELTAAVGSSVAELQSRLEQLRKATKDGARRIEGLEQRSRDLSKRIRSEEHTA